MIPLYRKLASDDQDSVRLLTIPDLIALAQNLSPEEVKSNLLDSLRASVTDKSWRVRYMVANEFVGLAESVGEAIIREELVGAFVGLLKDNEAEVRTAAASQIPGERGGPDPSRSRDSCRNPCRNPWALSHRLTSRRDFTGPGP
jgi:serine/threonine-protein phosphatase 2A regulatory subunit A